VIRIRCQADLGGPGVHLAAQRAHEGLQLVAARDAQPQQQVRAQRGARLRVVGGQVRRPRRLELCRVPAGYKVPGFQAVCSRMLRR
jgi:hypothetical protein